MFTTTKFLILIKLKERTETALSKNSAALHFSKKKSKLNAHRTL